MSAHTTTTPLQAVANQLDIPRTPFPHPYNAYPIQQQLMSQIYTTVKRKGVGIFESPTGTGKTLSIICSALHWLKEHQEYGSDEDTPVSTVKNNAQQSNEPDWCRNFEAEQAIKGKELELRRKKTLRSELDEKLNKLRGSDVLSDGNALRDAARRRRHGKEVGRHGGAAGRHTGKRARDDDTAADKPAQGTEDDQLAAEYSDSETEAVDGPRESRQRRSAFRAIGTGGGKRAGKDGLPQLSEEAARSMSIADQIRAELAASEKSAAKATQDAERSVADRRRGGGRDLPDALPWGEEEELERSAFRPQILYVSRTHSQVTQFVHEIGKTVFGRDLRVVSLGSRKSLCVHPTVSAFSSDSRINEVCLEMQDKAKRSASDAAAVAPTSDSASVGVESSSSIVDQVRQLKAAQHDPLQAHKGAGCPFLADPTAQNAYRDVLLARVRDVEESAALGEELKTCAYYGSRRAVKYAEVVAMPYSMLLHASTRASSGIDLRGAVVVIDEAHNVIDAINSSHAASVNSEQLSMAHATIRAYLAKYAPRMKPSNVQLCTSLADAVAGILAYLAGREAVVASLVGIQHPVPADSGPQKAAAAVDSGAKPVQPPAKLADAATAPATAVTTVLEPVKADLALPQRSVSPFASFFGGKPKHAAVHIAPPRPPSEGADRGTPYSRGSTPLAATDVPLPVSAIPSSAVSVPAAQPAPAPSSAAAGQSSAPSQLPALRAPAGDTVHSITGFHTAAGISHVNLFRVRRYVEAVELLKKLRGFAEAGARAAASSATAGADATATTGAGQVMIHEKPSQLKQEKTISSSAQHEASKSPAGSYMTSVTAMQQCWSFLTSLLLTDEDGRIIVTVPHNRAGGIQEAGAVQKKELPTARFVLLNPSLPFQEVLQKARSVILVGGTMQPVGDIIEQLFATVPPTRMVKTFSCGHIIPRENLSCLTVAAGPSAVSFDFRHGTRSDVRVIDELGRALVSLATLVPAGIVVFLPSFDYEMTVMQQWCRNAAQTGVQDLHGSQRAKAAVHASIASSATDTYRLLAQGGIPAGAAGSVLEQLQKRKAVFREPRSATQVDIVLKAYSSVISSACGGGAPAAGTQPGTDLAASPMDSDGESIGRASLHSYGSHAGAGTGKGAMMMSSSSSIAGGSVTSVSSLAQNAGLGAAVAAKAQTGAILFCVVGGKMSEGINFADDMARCVVVVGLPFANPSDPELKERMEYLNRGGAKGAAGKGAGGLSSNKGSEYYENLCMRAVNQSIGRSIRHKDDYSLICLLDGRYGQHRIKGKLPGWIGDRISDTHTWGQVVSATAEFFRAKKSANSS